MSDFDEVINRKNTSCSKWDGQGGDYIPLWVADMDFKSPKPIINAIIKRTDHGVFGYTHDESSLKEIIYNFYKKEYNYKIKKEWIVLIPSVMPGATMACRIANGDMMFNTPMYPHIRRLPGEVKCSAIEVPLKKFNGKYTFDFEAMQQKIDDNIKVFVLCNPHNPVGRVYSREELEELVKFCDENNLLLVSDEIHSELIFEGKHIPVFTLNEKAKNISITLTSPAKTYNIPALPLGFAIIPNEEIQRKFKKEIYGVFGHPAVLSVEAFKSAYTECDQWKKELLQYLKENRDYVEERVCPIKGLKINHNEGTYLAWIDASEAGIEYPYKFFLDKAKIKFSDGADFGKKEFVRINFGCPRANLKEAFDRIEEIL
ncbi:PatB family C-S lyase [Clostridium sp. YIM B02500]|uniref:MalY/PatB family protein n=1 Tax=Clostridium sp. YIM B02500 TaxID=2910681 RepID=UPI001EEDC222|nr:PatB family C-S lyase [Clostridium sp. YIM B02500]